MDSHTRTVCEPARSGGEGSEMKILSGHGSFAVCHPLPEWAEKENAEAMDFPRREAEAQAARAEWRRQLELDNTRCHTCGCSLAGAPGAKWCYNTPHHAIR